MPRLTIIAEPVEVHVQAVNPELSPLGIPDPLKVRDDLLDRAAVPIDARRREATLAGEMSEPVAGEESELPRTSGATAR